MIILELLASQLDREAKDFEIKAVEQIFGSNLDFWNLCLNSKQMLMEIKSEKD